MENTKLINAEALMSQLRHRMIMKDRFKLPMTKEDAVKVITAAVQVEVESRQRKFVLNNMLKEQVTVMADWLTSDSTKFGMLMCGQCGNGKSTLVKAFQRILNQANLRDEYNSSHYGIVIIDSKELVNLRLNNYAEWQTLIQREMLAVDDLGTESIEINQYGNIITPLIDLLTKRYDKQLFTLVTTNLKPAEIRERYGDRIADRLNEMMVKIIYRNDSYRV
jgi:DNA replication protein DnaC